MNKRGTPWRRSTKIVCTIGPSSGPAPVMRRLITAGMDVARLNLSHGTLEEHARFVETVRKLSPESGRPVSVLLDLPGPKYRIGKLIGGQTELRRGHETVLTERPEDGDATRLPVTLPGLAATLRRGQTLLLDDGGLQLKVLRIQGPDVIARVTIGGLLMQGKGLVAPGMAAPGPFLTGAMRQMVSFAAEQRPDYIALSFVSRPDDVEGVRALVRRSGEDIPIIAKIERREALRFFDDILDVSDGIMVARGDLGIEIPLERVPLVQKEIIKKCNRAGKPVITATEMLQSMVTSPRPTRAEITDVANAIFDGTDAVMLSGETSIGRYPLEAVKMMDRIARVTESALPFGAALAEKAGWAHESPAELIAYNACVTAQRLGAKAIVAFTQSGSTASRVSKYRPGMPILAITPGGINGWITLHWGVHPFRRPAPDSITSLFGVAADLAKDLGLAKSGDLIVITGGIPIGQPGTTNLLKVERIT